MRAYQLHSFDSEPSLIETITPAPSFGEVLVKIEACGLNFADTLMAKGKYQDIPPLPVTLGLELAGRIAAVPDSVSGLKPGEKVAIYSGHGGLADYGVFPAERCMRVPQSMSMVDAAGFQIAYGTSHLALDRSARLQPGETLLVTGASGGVGLTAVEIGKLMGARVIACARGAEKLAIATAAGADVVIDSEAPDLLSQLKAQGGIDVVYDTIGGPLFSPCLRACRPEARYLVIGFAAGQVQQIPGQSPAGQEHRGDRPVLGRLPQI